MSPANAHQDVAGVGKHQLVVFERDILQIGEQLTKSMKG